MSSVALPAASSGPAVRTEADLLRGATRSDREAFDELYLRHSQISWRLAQAVSPDTSEAGEAVADGFAQILRGIRRRRTSAEQPLRPMLLGAVYQSALERSHQAHAKAGASPETSAPVDPTAAPTASLAAFRSLPERWRAALWLAEVEHVSESSLVTVLGVSGPVATQLVQRGRQGLVARFQQAGVPVPDHLDKSLRPMAVGLPDGLAAVAARRWKTSVTGEAAGRLAPVTEWLAERGPRPLWTACGGLVALGVIGLGVLTVSSPPTPTGPAAAISAPPLSGGAPANPTGPNGTGRLLLPQPGGGSPFFPAADTTGASSSDPGSPIIIGEGSSAIPAVTSSTSGTSAPAAAPTAPTQGSSPTSPSSGSSPGGTQPVTTTPSTPAAKPLVNLPNVATVTLTPSTGAQATVGAAKTPVAAVAASPTCTGIEVLNITTNTCVDPSATGATTVPQLLQSLLGGLGLG